MNDDNIMIMYTYPMPYTLQIHMRYNIGDGASCASETFDQFDCFALAQGRCGVRV